MRDAGAKCERTARRVLGLTDLRPGQLAAMTALAEGRDTLVVMPTGAGKSAIYQVPALLLPGPTLVVSPLIALQRDQVESLRRRDEEAVSLDASTPASRRSEAFEALRAGETEFLFCAPEQLARPDVVRELAAASPRSWWWTRLTASPRGGMTSAPTTCGWGRWPRRWAVR
ncbi:DEAD/DEAH box helicase [Nonomuraea recticatena]|uniref:DEAD/DEAH box helicase n=1 Tax=Nonomuraea recticatena TaxID=46178 RepID=UPI003606814A